MHRPPLAATSDPPLRLPEDGPLGEQGRLQHDEYRLDPVIDALHRQLADWLDTPARQRAMIPPRIGLFGSLGQGKSTVLRNVVERLQRRRTRRQRWYEVVIGPRIARFDVSLFKADDLEWRFFTAVLWRRVLRNSTVAGFVVTVFLVSLVSIGMALGWWNLSACGSNVQGCWAWIVAAWAALSALTIPLLAGLKGAWNSAKATYKDISPANGLYLARRDRFIQTIARFLPALPDVVVVDDLDRAGVEQQRGFLRALSRFSQELGFAVVVCMDESEILAAKPNPEAPEELLRKTIAVELRVPERTREDVAMLAAVCAREFAKRNQDSHEHLARTLTSVQFLTDLMRTLLLNATDAPAHPRKVWRLLTGVAQQARQLRVTGAGDLSALMRIEGLYQLAPPLRRCPDKLREALEANRFEQFEPLLNGLGLDQRRLGTVRDFFQRTRMMQPTIQDGWFRLLGGFSDPGVLERESPKIWHADWTMGRRSVVFFRLFVEAIELDASGYAHDLHLDWFEPTLEPELNQPGPPPGYRFFIPGGYLEEFTDRDLPDAFRLRGSEYLAQCWLLWVCALVTTPAERRPAMYQRARRWIDAVREREPEQHGHLLDQFWREYLADTEVWDGLSLAQRRGFLDSTRRDLGRASDLWERLVGDGRLFALALNAHDFADAWSLLGDAGGRPRDGRSALAWWRHIVPETLEDRVNPTRDTSFAAHIWPAPRPETWDSKGWRDVLARHFLALNALNTKQRRVSGALVPDPLRYAWNRAQPCLEPGDCLDLVYLLACDPKAPPRLRWSLEDPRPWVESLEGRLLSDLQAVVAGPDPAEPGRTEPPLPAPAFETTPERGMALVLVAVLRGWRPHNAAKLVEGSSFDAIAELFCTLSDQGTAPDWLDPIKKRLGGREKRAKFQIER